MRDDGEGDGGSHTGAHLEGRAERDAVHQAVADHRRRRRESDLWHPLLARTVCRLAYGEQTLHQVRDEETAHEEQQGGGDTEDGFARGVDRFRQQVQSDHTEHQSAGEAEHQVAAVGDALGDPAAGQGHQERAERDEHRHALLLAD